MVFKNEKRVEIAKLLTVIFTSFIASFFITGVFPLERNYFIISIIILCVLLILICALYEEFHIQDDDTFLFKCFYYEKKIAMSDIKYVGYSERKITLYSQEDNIIHTFINDGSERIRVVVAILSRYDMPKIKMGISLFERKRNE